MIGTEGRMVTSQWVPPNGARINQAAVNPTQVIVTLGGGWIVFLAVEGTSLVEKRYFCTHPSFDMITQVDVVL